MGPGTAEGSGTAEAGTTLTSAKVFVAGVLRPKKASVVIGSVAIISKLCGVNVVVRAQAGVDVVQLSEKMVVDPNLTEKSWSTVG
jgi:hypothetical protein